MVYNYLILMQKLLYKIVGTAISFAVTRALITGFAIDNSLITYLMASVIFLLVNLALSPILKLILLPINILTLGIFRWIINVLVLYVFDLTYQGITISGYTMALNPPVTLSLFWVLVLVSFTMSVTYSVFTMFFHD